MRPISRAPARLSRGVAALIAVLAVGASGFYSWAALAVGTVGISLLAVGLVRGAASGVTLGAFGMFVAGLIAGSQNAPVVPVLVSVTGSVLAWDAGKTAISIGNQLGRAADTRRLEGVHLAASGAVGLVTAAVGYGLFRTGTGGQPIAALVFLLIAAVLLVEALR